MDPLSYIQVDLLKRFCALPKASPEREEMVYPLLLTTSAISSGTLNISEDYLKMVSLRGKKMRL